MTGLIANVYVEEDPIQPSEFRIGGFRTGGVEAATNRNMIAAWLSKGATNK